MMGLSALYGELIPRTGGRPSRIDAYTVSIALATGLTLLLVFSETGRGVEEEPAVAREPGRARDRAPGFSGDGRGAVARGDRLRGLFRIHGPVLFWPDFSGLLSEFSVLGRGLPPIEMFVQAAPLALAAYIIGSATSSPARRSSRKPAATGPTIRLTLDPRRTHLSIGLRNAGIALLGGPSSRCKGRCGRGRQSWWRSAGAAAPKRLRSLMDGVSSYYFFGLPLFYFVGPALELLRPALDVRSRSRSS